MGLRDGATKIGIAPPNRIPLASARLIAAKKMSGFPEPGG